MIYLGFSIPEMLHFLFKYCKDFQLCKYEDGWRCYALSDKYGELEVTGSLGYCVSRCFKPFVEKARAERKIFADKFNSIMGD